jgi:hypothetical protein
MAEGTFSIRVMDSDGRPASGIRVDISCGIWGSDDAYTDDDGWASFDVVGRVTGPGSLCVKRIWIDGEEVFDGSWEPQDGDTKSYSLGGDD